MKTLLYRLFATLGAFLLGAPLLILFGTADFDQPLVFLPWLLAALFCALLIRYCKKGRVVLCVLLTALIFGGILARAQSLLMAYSLFFPALICAGFVPLHLLMLCQTLGEEYPPTLWYIGMVVHALSLFLLRAVALAPAAPTLKAVSLAYFVYVIFALNELSLSGGMGGDKRPSPQMRWRNRLRAGLLALALVIAANLEGIRRGMVAVLRFVRDVVWRIIQWLMAIGTESVSENGSGGGLDLSELAYGAGETPLFWVILERILRFLPLIFGLVLGYFLLKKLSRLLVRLARLLWEQLRRYTGQINNAYEDTVESLLDWGELKRRMLRQASQRKRKKVPAIAWKQLSPRESVRMRYKVLRDQSKDAPGNLTARQVILQEHVSPQAADLYDRARYSSQEISVKDAEEMKKLVK